MDKIKTRASTLAFERLSHSLRLSNADYTKRKIRPK